MNTRGNDEQLGLLIQQEVADEGYDKTRTGLKCYEYTWTWKGVRHELGEMRK